MSWLTDWSSVKKDVCIVDGWFWVYKKTGDGNLEILLNVDLVRNFVSKFFQRASCVRIFNEFFC